MTFEMCETPLNLPAFARRLFEVLGLHQSPAHVRYLVVEVDDALALAEQTEL